MDVPEAIVGPSDWRVRVDALTTAETERGMIVTWKLTAWPAVTPVGAGEDATVQVTVTVTADVVAVGAPKSMEAVVAPLTVTAEGLARAAVVPLTQLTVAVVELPNESVAMAPAAVVSPSKMRGVTHEVVPRTVPAVIWAVGIVLR